MKGSMKGDVKVEQEALTCAQCHYCRVCPVYTVVGWESVSPRGRTFLLKSKALKDFSFDEESVEEFYKCTTCGACEAVCQTSIPLIDLWEESRAEFVKLRLAPLPVHERLRQAVEKHWNPYGEKAEERDAWMPEGVELAEEGELLYFAGCTASFRMKELAVATVKVLSKATEFAYAGQSEVCCGSPFLRTGQRDVARKLFLRNYREWERRGVKRIVTTCAGCYRTIARDYPKLAAEEGLDFDFEVIHTVHFVNELVEKGELSIKPLHLKATYHDPCHLGRHMGVYDEPRELIRRLGIELVEMERIRENAFCCGAGGGVKSQFKELAMEMGKVRIQEAKERADVLISCCPFCKLHLAHASKEANAGVKVLDLVELLEKAVE